MISILLLTLILFTQSKYAHKHVIQTSFTKKKYAFDLMRSVKYFQHYLDEVSASDIEFIPKHVKCEKILPCQQQIRYYSIPKISLLPVRIPKLQITQTWNIEENIFVGNIQSKYLDFDLTLEIKKNDKVYIEITGTINRKLLIIPNSILKHIIADYEGIFWKFFRSHTQ